MLPLAFWQGVQEFNQQQFYACHDTLEALWMEAAEPEKNFYQGILQIAVACYHLENYNWRGAAILLGEGSRRLSHYQPEHEGVDVAQLVQESAQLLKSLQQIDPDNIAEWVAQLKAQKIHPPEALGSHFPKIVKSHLGNPCSGSHENHGQN